jgi:hypothetical protein
VPENPSGVTISITGPSPVPLPPWRAGTDERKRQQMRAWVNYQLYEMTKLTGDEWLNIWSLKNLDALALQAAEQGDIRPLRKKYPHLAPFLHLPKLKRGEHFKEPAKIWLRHAREDVQRIRAIWRKHFGKVNRPRGELTAEEIAAERWNLTPDEVRRGRLSRKRPR